MDNIELLIGLWALVAVCFVFAVGFKGHNCRGICQCLCKIPPKDSDDVTQ